MSASSNDLVQDYFSKMQLSNPML